MARQLTEIQEEIRTLGAFDKDRLLQLLWEQRDCPSDQVELVLADQVFRQLEASRKERRQNLTRWYRRNSPPLKTRDTLVVEDADHLLDARANGNRDLHRFLTVADGVVQAVGRKIIFTTNLHNIGNIDKALIRPGRCFAVARARGLSREEAIRFLAALSVDHPIDTRAWRVRPNERRR